MGVMWIWDDSLKATVFTLEGASGQRQAYQNTFQRLASLQDIVGCSFSLLQHLSNAEGEYSNFGKQEQTFFPKIM